jgi:hypothetical protein
MRRRWCFDIAFLNAELTRAAKPPTATQAPRRTQHARRPMFALRVNSLRSKHGALREAEAAVYVELTTTRQAALQLEAIRRAPSNIQAIVRTGSRPLPPRATAEDRNAHRAFAKTLGSEAVWRDYFTIRNAQRGLTLERISEGLTVWQFCGWAMSVLRTNPSNLSSSRSPTPLRYAYADLETSISRCFSIIGVCAVSQ